MPRYHVAFVVTENQKQRVTRDTIEIAKPVEDDWEIDQLEEQIGEALKLSMGFRPPITVLSWILLPGSSS